MQYKKESEITDYSKKLTESLNKEYTFLQKLKNTSNVEIYGFDVMIKSVKHLDSDLAVTDNEIICNGVKVIDTLEHMPGHISIYIESMKTLISGDMLISEGGVLGIADEQFVLDKGAEINLLKKIVNLDIEKIVCFHGGDYKSNNLKEDLEKIIAKGYND